MWQLLIKFFSVFALASVEFWAAVPLGLAMKLDPLLTGLATASGAVLGVVIVITLGSRVRDWMLKKKKVEQTTGGEQKERLIIRIWNKYGVAGLGLLGPLLVGAPLGAAIGVSLGAATSRLLFWMTMGILLWTAGLTVAGVVGIETFSALWHQFF
jgi:hypothetical protein